MGNERSDGLRLRREAQAAVLAAKGLLLDAATGEPSNVTHHVTKANKVRDLPGRHVTPFPESPNPAFPSRDEVAALKARIAELEAELAARHVGDAQRAAAYRARRKAGTIDEAIAEFERLRDGRDDDLV
jgi:BMFP domain-containing protein YqiC